MMFLQNGKKGIALVMVIIILVGLCVMAVSFCRMTSLSVVAATNLTLTVQAKWAAMEGIEYVESRLRHIFKSKAYSDSQDDWQYREDWKIELAQSLNPSFKMGELVLDSGKNLRRIAYSGFSQNSFPYHCYSLKVENSNAFVNINDKSSSLHMILTNLCRVLALEESVADRIVQNRGMGYHNRIDILRRNCVSPQQYQILKNFITVRSWSDHRAIISSEFNNIKTEQRSPIDINSARYEIIVATLCGIKGVVKNTVIDVDIYSARNVASHILEYREQGSFTSWQEFLQFLLSLAQRRTISREQAELIYINSNSNVHLNVQNPDTNVYRLLNKLDVKQHSTEFCLGPLGIFEVASIARILTPTRSGYRVQAQYSVECDLQLFDVFRHSSQKDFEQARLPGENLQAVSTPNRPDQSPHPHMGNLFRGNPLDFQFENGKNSRFADGSHSTTKKNLQHKNWGNIDDGQTAFFFKPENIKPGQDYWIACNIDEAHSQKIMTGLVYRDGVLRVIRSLVANYGDTNPLASRRIRVYRGSPMRYDLLQRLYKKGLLEYDRNLIPKVIRRGRKLIIFSIYERGQKMYAQMFRHLIYQKIRNGDPNFKMLSLLLTYNRTEIDLKTGQRTQRYHFKMANTKIDRSIYDLIFDLNIGNFETFIANRDAKQIESSDIKEFAGFPRFHPYRYSRYEKSLKVRLENRQWYYFHVSWKGIKIQSACVCDDHQQVVSIADENRDVSGGPLCVRRIDTDMPSITKFQTPGTYYNAKFGEYYRYQNTSFVGQFRIPPNRYIFGTVYWNQYSKYPENYVAAEVRINQGYWNFLPSNDGTEQLRIAPYELLDNLQYRFHFVGRSRFTTAIVEDVYLHLFYPKARFLDYRTF